MTTASVYLCVQILSAFPPWSISGCSSGLVVVSPSQFGSNCGGWKTCSALNEVARVRLPEYKAQYDSEHTPVMIAVPPTAPSETPGPPKKKLVMGPDNFMDQFIKKREPTLVTSVSATQVINPLEEFDQYFSWPCVD